MPALSFDALRHRMISQITVIGGGFAGVEAAWAAAQRGVSVTLWEMRPNRNTAVHKSGDLAELVCSNSFKSALLTNASGVLKEEMRRMGSLILPAADHHRVPAGEALAVDREAFAQEVTTLILNHPLITIRREEASELPSERPVIIATGPLTSGSMVGLLASLAGEESLYFYDAVAPTVSLESINQDIVYRASRRGKNSPDVERESDDIEEGDYLNCPMTKEEYLAFHHELIHAETSSVNNPEEKSIKFFEMCLPIEEIAVRGERTLAFGPLKPIGLVDPRTGVRPYAVVQLRQENRFGSLWGLVGFQTRLKWGEQKRVFRMIPGLENAEFVRYGVMHRNTYLCSPKILDSSMQFLAHPGIFLAGQITGVEGYLESAAIGLMAGWNAARMVKGMEPSTPPAETVLGSLCRYLVETDPRHFSPMNANWGITPNLEERIRDKKEKGRRLGLRAVQAIDQFIRENEIDVKTS
jgi:methylenetetrahydrofolate--tRNA-(uracil-5-)-methyltransferase